MATELCGKLEHSEVPTEQSEVPRNTVVFMGSYCSDHLKGADSVNCSAWRTLAYILEGHTTRARSQNSLLTEPRPALADWACFLCFSVTADPRVMRSDVFTEFLTLVQMVSLLPERRHQPLQSLPASLVHRLSGLG